MIKSASKAVFRVDAAGVVATGALCVGVVLMGMQPVSESERHAAALRAEVSAAADETSKLSDKAELLKARAASLRVAIDENAVELRPSGSVNAQIARITDLANDASLTLGEIAPGKETTLTAHIERPVSLSGAGAFVDVVRFMQRLEARFPDLRVRSMNIRGSLEGPGTTSFTLELTWFSDRNGGE